MEKRKRLSDLVMRYKAFSKSANKKEITEETTRTWLNEMLMIFDWDVQNTNQVLQEIKLGNIYREKLSEINSTHIKPDYSMINGKNIKTFLDAKSPAVNLFTDKNSAFQIKSYGWSANVPCAYVSNFEQFVIYDCRFAPEENQEASCGAIQLDMNEYIEKYEILEAHLERLKVYNNCLITMYETVKTEGVKTVDAHFNNILSEFRLQLANQLYKDNLNFITNDEILNYYVQVILDRIVYIRVCESRGIEKTGLLKEFLENGFWDCFKKSCYMQFYEHYDGAMFERDNKFQTLVLDNNVFENFIRKLYYPYPYRFDVIPVKVLAKVYEQFLTYGLTINNGHIKEKIKEDYVKANGAIATPEYIVEAVCHETILLEEIHSIEELLKLKIFDPCCGSGIFLIVAFEILSDKMKEILLLDENCSKKYNDYYVVFGEEIYLSVFAKRAIITNCLYGIDYDEVAIEVTKMSLALKVIDDNNIFVLNEIGLFGNKILCDLHNNILLGNTLVDSDIVINASDIADIKPIDIRKTRYKSIFDSKDGFDFVVGNPPYVETKNYKQALPIMHQYLSAKYSTFEGKADLSVLFIERCLSILNAKGKLGFIVQRRWFKTEYGKGIRKLISQTKCMSTLFDIKTNNIFYGRITYVSIMVLNKSGCDSTKYSLIPGEVIDVKNFFELKANKNDFDIIPTAFFTSKNWSPEFYEIEKIKAKLAKKFGTLGSNGGIHVKDGIQALWKKAYHFSQYSIEGEYVIGKNGFGMIVKIEKEIVKPVIYNKLFYPFKDLLPNAYCIFPYEGQNNRNRISIKKIEAKYPNAYKYLTNMEIIIKQNVESNAGDEWHTFTREHNHDLFDKSKIIIPMTAKDTIATYVNNKGLYMDNSNVWFLTVDGENEIVMKALAAIVNSTVFSVFAKAGANPQSGGYYKFNKQFLTPVPLPNEKINSKNKEICRLADLYVEIFDLQERYITATNMQKIQYESILNKKWMELDQICDILYELTEQEIFILYKYGRTIDRIEILSGVDETC